MLAVRLLGEPCVGAAVNGSRACLAPHRPRSAHRARGGQPQQHAHDVRGEVLTEVQHGRQILLTHGHA